MGEFDELDAMIADAITPDVDEFKTSVGEHIAAFEQVAGRAATQDEVDELVGEIAAAHQHADVQLSHFQADVDIQLPQLEQRLGRKLLAHEREGIRDVGAHRMFSRGEPLDAKAAYETYWSDRGEAPPTFGDPGGYEESAFLAERFKERLVESQAAVDEAAALKLADRYEAQLEREALRDLPPADVAVPMRQGSLDGPAQTPDWSQMTSEEVDAAMAGRVAGGAYIEREDAAA